ncbi:hypothetical protein HY621_03185 [Candidatus Uhrbacteria bacterium]|nr:hypothetical protein [Candidatus Uhrbacteria bacterium]
MSDQEGDRSRHDFTPEMGQWAKKKYAELLYRAKYDYAYDRDPQVRSLMDRGKRKAIEAMVRSKGIKNLTHDEMHQHQLVRRYENNKFRSPWFTATLSTIRDIGESKLFTPRESVSDMNVYLSNEANRLLLIVIPIINKSRKKGIPSKYVDKVEQLLDVALENLFPGKSQEQIAEELGIEAPETIH